MRISDWSSDVCSSDLVALLAAQQMVNELAQGAKAGKGHAALLRAQRGGHQCAFETELRRFLETQRPMGDRTQLAGQRDFRSEERRGGKEWVRTCRSRWSTVH